MKNHKTISVITLLIGLLLSVTTASAACDKEIGACRISDLNKSAESSPIIQKVIPPKKESPSKKTPDDKLNLKKFIISLLKPSG